MVNGEMATQMTSDKRNKTKWKMEIKRCGQKWAGGRWRVVSLAKPGTD